MNIDNIEIETPEEKQALDMIDNTSAQFESMKKGERKVISCKEDLLNTYIENDNGELLYAYLSELRRFGFKWPENTVWDWQFCYASNGFECPQQAPCDDELINEGWRKLTLSDLKPKRTKVEYKKVLSVFNLDRDKMRNGEYGELDADGEFYSRYEEVSIVLSLTNNGLYEKAEKEVEWWEAAAEYAQNVGSVRNISITGGDMSIQGYMTKGQWKEFAKLILEGCE